MTHTLGPWSIMVDNDSTWIDSPQQMICTDVSNCDANLIAAAPELLEALQVFAEHFGPLEDNHMLNDEVRRCFSLARAAIAKATGETK